MSRVTDAVRRRFLRFRREMVVVVYAIGHPDTPLRLRVAGFAFLAYLASPIDLIPLVVPVAGILDDLILVPWGLSQVVQRLPETARADAEERARHLIHRYVARPVVFLLVLVLALLVLWGVFLLALAWLLTR